MGLYIDVNENLLREAMELSGYETAGQTAEAALREFVTRRKQSRVVELFGNVEYEPGFQLNRLRAERIVDADSE